jgi:hypothetical protein
LGDNVVESRNKLLEFNKDNYPEYETAHLSDCPQEKDFQEKINTAGFFSAKQLFIFESFFKGKAPKWKTEINFESLEKSDNIFIFWEETMNVAGKKAILSAAKSHVFEFKIPNLLWNFLDNIKSVRVDTGIDPYKKNIIETLRTILKSVDANYLFLMLVRQFRLLILIQKKYRDYPSDYKRLTFQKYKLEKQAAFFKEEYLQDTYHQLLDIETRQKTGNAIYDLKTELEKLLLDV